MSRKSPEGPEFAKPSGPIASNGGGVSKVPGSPSNSIAIDEASDTHISTFGYNTKDPAATIHRHIREERYGR